MKVRKVSGAGLRRAEPVPARLPGPGSPLPSQTYSCCSVLLPSSTSEARMRPPAATQAPVSWRRSCGAPGAGCASVGTDAVRPRLLGASCGGQWEGRQPCVSLAHSHACGTVVCTSAPSFPASFSQNPPWLQTAGQPGRRCCAGCPAARAPPRAAAAPSPGAPRRRESRHATRCVSRRNRCPCGAAALQPAAPWRRCARSNRCTQRRGQCTPKSRWPRPQRAQHCLRRCCRPGRRAARGWGRGSGCASGGGRRPGRRSGGAGSGPGPPWLRRAPPRPPTQPGCRDGQGHVWLGAS